MQTNWQEKAKALGEAAAAMSGISNCELRVANFFQTLHSELGIRDSGFATAVACSGGADSLAALLLTWAEFPEAREHLCVLHFDHAVRADSASDAEFVRDVCASLGVEFVCGKRAPETPLHSGENALRKIRLEFFAREMNARGIKVLVQGHQRDDIAETLLMRLTRGAGTDGLAAPRKISRQADGRVFVRPLLDVPKEKILSALRACDIPWREDSTNAGTEYFRNRVRNRVLPELRAAAPFENIARSRKLAEEDADALDFLANEVFERMGEAASRRFRENEDWSEDFRTEIPFREIFESHGSGRMPLLPSLVRRVLRKIFLREKIETDGAAVADALVDAICAGTPFKTQIASREIIWDNGHLKIQGRSDIPVASRKSFKGNSNEATGMSLLPWKSEKVWITDELFAEICAGKFSCEETVFLAGTPEIFVRELLPGEKFRPLGAPGEKPVSRIFTDKKIPSERRAQLPVFADGTGIAWIPGLPPAERFRIRAAGTTALRLTYRRESLPL